MIELVQATLLPVFFAAESGELECTVEPKSAEHFGRVFNVTDAAQFRAIIGLKQDILLSIAGYIGRFSDERKSAFKGAFFVNKDIHDHVLAIPVPLMSMNFIATNFDRIARGELIIDFSAEIQPLVDDGWISTACEFVRTPKLRIKEK